jgi:hypothetical protein
MSPSRSLIRGVVVGRVEHAGAASVAGEQQRAHGHALGAGTEQRLTKILVGGCGVADLELHGSADIDEIADPDRPGFLVRPGDRSDQEVAAGKFRLVLIDGKAEV